MSIESFSIWGAFSECVLFSNSRFQRMMIAQETDFVMDQEMVSPRALYHAWGCLHGSKSETDRLKGPNIGLGGTQNLDL